MSLDLRSEEVTWRKSSYSGGTGGDCVELACATAVRLVRDSKNPEVVLAFGPRPVGAFVEGLKNSSFGG